LKKYGGAEEKHGGVRRGPNVVTGKEKYYFLSL